ncbi:hypothetical protein GCM10022252_03720 [Streptosporangium oxazolinicum]|uniref:RNA polymerase sigma-70 region 2 domain-containing protein n=1 Tax=Streptosporangium oxazolinicum TaxID=909287 RepID=A0ABP8AA32_9ACTN
MTGFAEYVERLRRAADLLTGDRATAEDLVRTAPTGAWLARRRIDGDPGPYVHRVIVGTTSKPLRSLK